MTAFAVVLILRGFLEVGSDHVDGVEPKESDRHKTYPDGSPVPGRGGETRPAESGGSAP
jgi:hypothetical protein